MAKQSHSFHVRLAPNAGERIYKANNTVAEGTRVITRLTDDLAAHFAQLRDEYGVAPAVGDEIESKALGDFKVIGRDLLIPGGSGGLEVWLEVDDLFR